MMHHDFALERASLLACLRSLLKSAVWPAILLLLPMCVTVAQAKTPEKTPAPSPQMLDTGWQGKEGLQVRAEIPKTFTMGSASMVNVYFKTAGTARIDVDLIDVSINITGSAQRNFTCIMGRQDIPFQPVLGSGLYTLHLEQWESSLSEDIKPGSAQAEIVVILRKITKESANTKSFKQWGSIRLPRVSVQVLPYPANTPGLIFVTGHGRPLFTSADIVQFDWDRQVFKLTPRASQALRASVTWEYWVTSIIYKGNAIGTGTIYLSPFDGCPQVQPPYYYLGAWYGEESPKTIPLFKSALKEAGVLGRIP